ncbi:GMC oxidoreductase [Hirsutella rhossiliensis]|uniref:GMC oxidoreductase domain-containing protein n=1 Tax=Hirsutella rhossiliensis TaxID=111463 RepID=A0A9P8SHA2_9HYPO|nr:GMC oxidoreductase domain-containing protein [Hirsutella rhossiliensis]KAH0961954.1 GMC oxidoreductase domain-containing protein [Hirsutella rhossiliensis]
MKSDSSHIPILQARPLRQPARTLFGDATIGIIAQLPPWLDEVDVIIAGGGTAGCVVASRLSDADPDLAILVIEGDQDNYNDPSIILPVLFPSHLMPTSRNTLFYMGVREPKLGNRELMVPSGGVLGGGSSINLMTYSRAQRRDFDSWKMPGWYADELLPFIRKLETYYGPGPPETHGTSGSVQISSSAYNTSMSENDFIQASAKVGILETVDIQDLNTGNAAQRNLRFINPEGHRQDAAHTYLHPRLQDGKHEKLHVLVKHQVPRVLLDKKKAVGVEYRPNSVFHADATALQAVRARKLVVVSAGALGSPLVLERSGIGDAAVLDRAGIAVVAELPGIGRNYMDHHLLTFPYRSILSPRETIDAQYGGRVDIGGFIAAKDSMLGWNAADVTATAKMPRRGTLRTFPGDPTRLAAAQFMSVSTFTVYPYSRGHMHITGQAMSDEIEFKMGFLADERNLDIKSSILAYQKQREILRRMKVYRGEHSPGYPPFAAGSDAACKGVDGPLKDVRDTVYTEDDNVVLEQWKRKNVGSARHSLGTCKMALREEGVVVDGSLGVYGVEGLKVADMSIAPQNVGANTGNTAFVIGEKAADLFIRELAISS